MDTITAWLSELGLSQYAEDFQRNDIGLDLLESLTDQDLRDLGVQSLGHRKTLLKAIAESGKSEAGTPASGSRIHSPLPASAAVRPGVDGERRQLTVMFCDMVGSTELSQKLDPEALRELILAYQQVCGDVTEKYAGHVAQYLGDGLLIYFGHPVAHEDDPERAVRAALGILTALETLTTRHAIRPSVRIGIHTGLVVVGEVGSAGRHEQLALGPTPNLAARLQAAAEPDSILISDATHRSVEGLFTCLDRGALSLKGISEPVHARRVLGESEARGRLDAAARRGLTPLVGRSEEMGLLLQRWEQVTDGHGQAVLLTAEPGIGKSRMMQELRARLADEPHVERELRCSPYHQHSPLYPVIELIPRVLGWRHEHTVEAKLAALKAELIQAGMLSEEPMCLLAALLSLPLPEGSELPAMSAERQKQRTLETLLAWLTGMAADRPALLVVEDLHWMDPSTQEFLTLLIDQAHGCRLLLLMTARPSFVSPWGTRSHLTHHGMTRFTRRQTEQMITRVAGNKALPPEVVQEIVEKTDGVPLFVEEFTKLVIESGLLQEYAERYELDGALPPLAIPSTLQDSLMARLDRLGTAKEVAQLAAVLGRAFPFALLRAVSDLDEAPLQAALSRLVDAELLHQRGVSPQATYVFKHALIQDAAYQSLLKSVRQPYHQRVADALVERFPEEVEARPAYVAHHYTEAGLLEKAIRYWTHAGQLALQRSANLEAISHFSKGLELLNVMPPASVDPRQELALWLGLCPAYIATRGFSTPEVERAALRSRELCENLGEVEGAALASVAKFAFHFVRAELRQARVDADAGLALAQRTKDPQLVALMNMLIGDLCYWEGNFGTARRCLSEALIPWDVSKAKSLAERSGLDAHCVGLAYVAHIEFAMGYPDRSQATLAESLRDAQLLGHAQSRGHCLGLAGWLAVFRRDPVAARQLANRTIEYCREQRVMFWEASGYLVDGWALIQEGKMHEGAERMHQGFTIRRAAGAALVHSSFQAVLAECHGMVGEYDTGLTLVEEGLTHVEWSGERTSESELHRVRGELLLAKAAEANTEAAAQCFDRAIAVARQQGAKLLELRSTLSLARLRRDQSKRKDAHDLLAPVYNWFTEGFDTKDLKEAKALLEELQR